MTRRTAASVDDICARHLCVRHTDLFSLEDDDLQPYDTIAIAAGGTDDLSAALTTIRTGYEVREVYVKTHEDGQHEPLTGRHLSMVGSVVVVARRRHSNGEPRIVGIMLAKDESDVIPDVIGSLHGSLDALYYLPGDELTAKSIVAASPTGWARAIADPGLPHADGLRRFLHEQARQDAITDADPRPMWVMVVQGDEVYHDDLRQHVLLAQKERATVMTCQVATFLLHESQRESWDWTQPLATRMTHYIWDFGEHAGFLDFPWMSYVSTEHMRAHPHGIYPAKWATAHPVRKHYPFRSPEQAAARLADRLRPTATQPHGWQPHYRHYASVFVGDKAAGREVKQFFGWFPDAERVDGIW